MLIIFFIFSTLILFSTIGFGLIFSKILKFENFNYNYGIIGILGLFILSVIASYTHLVVSHHYVHNIILILIGLMGLLFLNKSNLNEIKFVFFTFILLFIALIIAKTNEDFGYYHLPNSLQFSEQKLQFGLGNLNHGFKHVSSLFMIMSLNYLPYVDHFLFNLTNFLFLTFFVSFVLKEVYFNNKKNLNLSNFVISLFLVLVLSKFSRLAEYGSDIAGQLVILISFFYILEFFFNESIKENKINYLKISILLIIFASTLKFISVIYVILFVIFLLKIKKKLKTILSLVQINFIIYLILATSIFLFLNFTATGCVIYPIEITCTSNYFEWALDSDVVQSLNFVYEVWSKGGLGPGFSVDNQNEYIKHLNWVPNWTNVYFIGKFSDYIFITILIIFIYACFFFKDLFYSKKINLKKNKSYLFFYFLIAVIFFVWFLNFPTLRYSGYVIVFMLLIFPFSIYASQKISFTNENYIKKISIIFLISYSIFLFKNISRISNELKLAETGHHNFSNFPFYWTDKKSFKRIKLNNHDLYLTNGKCWDTPSTCVRFTDSIKITKKNNYIFYIKTK